MPNSNLSEHLVAYFISPHGFGHGARAAAVMSAIHEIAPSVQFEIYTKVPQWFFQPSLSGPFNYHSLLTDIGLVQKNSLHEDIKGTLESLDRFFPLERFLITKLAETLNTMKCEMVVCDISPMGIVAARESGVPSVLVENFTWDWIYEGYVNENSRLHGHINYLQKIFESADYHIQGEPVCHYSEADLVVNPISRKFRTPAKSLREKLKIPKGLKVVLITMGGIPGEYSFLKQLEYHPDIYFVIPGGSRDIQIYSNIILLPHRSDFFHPDLINASDMVIGKLGYSTLAEVYYAGIPFGYVIRPNFRESEKLAGFVKKNMKGFSLTEAEFQNGSWLYLLSDYLTFPRLGRNETNGANQAAGFICELLRPEG
jgi:UDP-N-acetylglucosamine:LPS N-acetylglucosamine transferase